MLQETMTLYRLTILYLLYKTNYPLSTNTLTGFLLSNDFVDYFNLQQLIGELIDDGYVSRENTHGKTLYRITPSGEDACRLFSDKLSKGIKNDIDSYIKDHNMELRDDTSVLSRYYEEDPSHYTVNMYIEEAGRKVLELNVTVSSADEAEKMCTRWTSKSEELYPMIMKELMK